VRFDLRSVLFCAVVVLFSDAAVGEAGSARPLKRPDPVIIEGRYLPKIKGAKIDRIGVFVYRGDGWEPIPFQVDEKAAKGRREKPRYVIPPEADSNPTFDDDDELVFIARDLGLAAPSKDIPLKPKVSAEIAVTDPSSRVTGYAYVMVFDKPPDKASGDYVGWRAKRRLVISPGRYEVGYPKGDAFFFNKFAVPSANGGDGSDFVDTLKMRANARLVAQLFEYDITNSDWRNDLIGIKDGPVRVIRRVKVRVNSALFRVHKSVVDVIYYPDFFSMDVPVPMGMKYVPPLYQSDLRLSLDLANDAPPMSFFNDRNLPAPEFVADGVMTKAEKKLDNRSSKWLCLSGEPGTVLMRLDQKPGVKTHQDLYYYDNSKKRDPPEEFPGHRGDSGFYISKLEDVKKSERVYKLTFAFPSSGSIDKIVSYVSAWKEPLEVLAQKSFQVAQYQPPYLYPDLREKKPRPAYLPPLIKTKTRAILPQFSVDPNVGYGLGIQFVERKTFGTNLSSDLGFLLTHRLHQFHRLEEIYKNLGPISEARLYLLYMQHPNKYFFGIGNDREPDDLAVFRQEQVLGRVSLKRKVTDWFVAGVRFKVEHNWVGHGELYTRYEPSIEETYGPPEDIDEERFGPEVYGLDGGWTNSLDFTLALDFRDDERYPTRGTYDIVGVEFTPKWLGSDYEYTKYRIDLRYYYGGKLINRETEEPRNLWLRHIVGSQARRVLAMRLFAQRTDAPLVGFADRTAKDVPFYNLSGFGGATVSRGHYEGQWKDNDITFAQVELRWRFWKITDGTVFYDVGKVWENINNRAEWRSTDWTDIHSSYGVGLVWRIVPDIVLRVNYGFSKENPSGLLYVWAYHTF